jgi:DNA-binding Lrp family transcriptional regulator
MPSKVVKVLENVKGVRGVVKAFPVYGRYDIVAFAELPDYNSVSRVSSEINAIKGIKSKETVIEG